MDPEEWQKIRAIFDDVLRSPPDEREASLTDACGGDPELRADVESLLDSFDEGFLEDAGIAEVADLIIHSNKKLAEGQHLRHYRIICPIGSGGMGEVYLAQDTKLNRRVAVKVLPYAMSSDPDSNRRFSREARAAAALDHPNICSIYEVGEEDGNFFIVMQYVEGDTLAEKLAHDGLSATEALDIAIQMADALDEAQGQGIVHRDIKPSNIIVNKKGKLKILDFGLAKFVESKSEDETAKLLSTSGAVMGTVPYMSPEQVRGKKLDTRTDIFSLGVVLYEMLSGRQPFSRESNAETISAILNDEPAMSDIPIEFRPIVERALTKNVEKRYQTAADLLAGLKCLETETTSAGHAARSSAVVTRIITGDQPVSSAEYIVNQVRSHRLVALTALVIVALIAGAFGYFGYYAAGPGDQIESIAVMPFVNDGGNAEVEYLSDGMTESLINSLSQLPKLNIKARSSVFRYKGIDKPPQQIAAELKVQAILIGHVVQRGEQLLLSLELIDATTENVIWTEQYNRTSTDLVSLQAEIARDVSNKLRVKLSVSEEQLLTKNYTNNDDAYRLYLQGRFFLNNRTSKDFERAISYFNQAISIDENYALAYVGLAETFATSANYNFTPPAESMPKAKENALRALSLDSQLAEAHTALGGILLNFEFDFAGAETAFMRAIEISPNYPLAHQYRGNLLACLGRHDEAIAYTRRALEIDPLSVTVNEAFGARLFIARRYDESIEQLRKVVELDPNYASVHDILGYVYWVKGDHAALIEEFARARELYGVPAGAKLIRDSFNKGGWENYLRTIVGTDVPFPVRPYVHVIFQTKLGNKEKAIEKLYEAYENRESNLLFVKVDPRLDDLRGEPRFQEFLQKMKFPS